MNLGQVFSYALTAAVPKEFPGGRFVRLLTCDAAVTVELRGSDGSPLGSFSGVKGGFQVGVDSFAVNKDSPLLGFGKVVITSATNQTVEVVVSRVPVRYDRLTGSVVAEISVGETLDSLADDSIAATTAEMVAASDANRRALIITNLATNVGEKRVGDSGVGAANGIPLPPGESVTLDTTAEVWVYNAHSSAESVAITAIKD